MIQRRLLQVSCFYDFRRVEYRCRRAIGDDFPIVENEGTGSIFKHQVHIVCDEHYSYALTVEILQKVHNLGVVLEVLTGGWFIEQDNLRLQYEDGCNGHALFLAVA